MIRPNFAFVAIVTCGISLCASVAFTDDVPADWSEHSYRIGGLDAAETEVAESENDVSLDFVNASDGRIRSIVHQPEPVFPESTPDETTFESTLAAGASLFGYTAARDGVLSGRRRSRLSYNAEVVLGSEAKLRVTTDAGNLLGKSTSALGIGVQYRSPVTTDTRVRGARVGQFLASGSYWFPARADLDTMLSKIDSRIIDHMLVIKGPYAVRYGPGYHFVDVALLPTPRYLGGHETHGSTSVDYKTNGEQLYGRQSFWGGSENWGYRVSYGHRTGNDYDTGGAADGSFFQPASIPASYNSRDFDVAIGWNPTEFQHWEFNYLRLDQSDVEYAGFSHDIDFLETDAFKLRYVNENPAYADLFEAEGWYNRTIFEGNNQGAAKLQQIPNLQVNPTVTDADAMSTGYRFTTTWGNLADSYLSLGTDLIYLTTELNEINAVLPNNANRFLIPNSRSADFGVFAERGLRVNDCVDVTVGARLDVVSTDAENDFPDLASLLGFTQLTDEFRVAQLGRQFTLWSAFLSARRQVSDGWQTTASVGYAQRPPTLTELYSFVPFIEFLPNSTLGASTQLLGDPRLDPEQIAEFDVVLQADYPYLRGSLRGFVAYVHDYISFDFQRGVPGVANQVTFVNTNAVLGGFELYAERDVSRRVTAFANANYVAGQDLTRDRPSRIRVFRAPGTPRSGVAGQQEPLPNMPPFEARLGLRLHEPGDDPSWGVEVSARMVNDQGSIAASLNEFSAVGFTIWDMRAFWRVHENMLLVGGVENIGDRFYREHLDSLVGRGVFRPGVTFYFGSEITY